MSWSRLIAVAGCSAFLAASVAAAPWRAVPLRAPEEDKVGVAIALQVAGEPYQVTGKAKCTHEPKGYIYGTPAKQWVVEHNEGRRSFHLTFWRPASGAPDMFSLWASTGTKSHTVSTTKGPGGGNVKGSGQVKLTSAGSGGTFALDATTASGGKIGGTVKCDGFTAAIAEGGE
jgi:hypothetical protein